MSTHVQAAHSVAPPSIPGPRSAEAWSLQGAAKVGMVLLLGAALGLGSTANLLHRRSDPTAVTIGSWVTWPKAGTADIDPYAHAIYAETGEIPLAAAEGLTFMASADRTGAMLSARCSYRIAGPVPAARFWTLTAATPSGLTMDNPAGRSGFSSSEILRRDDGTFVIAAAPSARPGNWLPLSGDGHFVLALRLYDTPLASISANFGKSALPAIERLGCAS